MPCSFPAATEAVQHYKCALPPGQIVVDARKLAAVWVDLGKLRACIDGLGILESDLPPSWWDRQAISG